MQTQTRAVVVRCCGWATQWSNVFQSWERTVETLLHHPEWQDIQFERLERRLQQLEPVVRVLRRQFAEFSQDMEKRHPKRPQLRKTAILT